MHTNASEHPEVPGSASEAPRSGFGHFAVADSSHDRVALSWRRRQGHPIGSGGARRPTPNTSQKRAKALSGACS
eukprot:15454650-Alexandrium_andersonii.AAC.1